MVVSERAGGIDEQDIQVRTQPEVLEPVVEDERVGVVFLDGVEAGFHAVLVDQHDHVLQVCREHVRLVARGKRVQEQVFAVGNDTRRDDHAARGEFAAEFFQERAVVAAAVAAAQDGDAAAFSAQRLCEDLDDRGLARSAAREVADADHEAADGVVADYAVFVEPKPELDGAAVEARGHEQKTVRDAVE